MVEPGVAAQPFDGPNRIGPYELIAKLAQGGMGTVYLARMGGPAGFNKLAVVKELKEELLGSARFAQLFLEEARLAARLTHANIVHTYGAGEYDGRLYIAMEYLDGQPWTAVRHRLKANHALPLHVQLKVLADALAGLHYAHELREFNGKALNVVHCDMSPQNVFVTYDGQVKVVDFGVARAAHDGAPRKDNVFLGKVAYCAPEQAKGEPLDRRADIFAVGVMLWEAISGQRFAVGDDPSAILQARAQGVEQGIRDVVPTTPRALASLCDRALSLHPGDRFATAADFRMEIVEFLTQNGKSMDGPQLGRLVSNAFESERKRIHGLIDRELGGHKPKGPHGVTDMSGGESALPADCTLQADLSRLASVTRLSDEGTMSSAISASLVSRPNSVVTPLVPPPQTEEEKRKKLPAALISVAGVALLGTALFVATHSGPTPPEAPPTSPPAIAPQVPSTSATPPIPTTAEPTQQGALQTLSLRLKASPEGAEILLDGNKVATNPFEAKPVRDHAMHKVKITASGYRSEERVLVFDRDIELEVELSKLPVPSRAPTVKYRRPSRKPTPAPPKPADPAEAAATELEPKPAAAPTPARRDKANDVEKDSRKDLKIYDEDPYQ